MNISKVNDLLGQVRVRLESLDPNNQEENIHQMTSADPKSIGAANSKLTHLMAKLTAGRSKSTKVRATGTSKRG
jgi:hypothetical protein